MYYFLIIFDVMTSVITGDIIGSRQHESQHWVEDLKNLSSAGQNTIRVGSLPWR